jgi:3-deoxy-D-manno-octulosonic acid kinase
LIGNARTDDATEPDLAPRRLQMAATVILYDAAWADRLLPAWFDLRHWEARAALRGAAGGRGTTWFVGADGVELALRHYQRGGLMARVSADRYAWFGEQRSRPAREFAVHRQLQQLGLPVPRIVGVRIVRDGLTYRGDILTERLADVRTLAQRLPEAALSVAEWIELGRCLRRFHDAGLDHADLNAHNILWRGSGEVFLIDFDRGRLRSRGLWCDANLARLRRSLLKVTRTLPADRFSETDWHSLLAGYWAASGAVGATVR